jgi:hypothetical protein
LQADHQLGEAAGGEKNDQETAHQDQGFRHIFLVGADFKQQGQNHVISDPVATLGRLAQR